MKNRLLILSLLVSVPAFAWQPQTGDIIFQISRSSQSKAIQLATHSDYSHTGMLVMRNKKPYVFEAVGPVKYTPLKQWIAHGEKGKYVVRRVEGGLSAYSALFDHGLASKSDQRFASIRSTGNLTFSTAF
nr:YiiX/YebB-like N1pC/P60 family cysteine hydrolase [Escherichia coli]